MKNGEGSLLSSLLLSMKPGNAFWLLHNGGLITTLRDLRDEFYQLEMRCFEILHIVALKNT